jgi:hypothetical protein
MPAQFKQLEAEAGVVRVLSVSLCGSWNLWFSSTSSEQSGSTQLKLDDEKKNHHVIDIIKSSNVIAEDNS